MDLTLGDGWTLSAKLIWANVLLLSTQSASLRVLKLDCPILCLTFDTWSRLVKKSFQFLAEFSFEVVWIIPRRPIQINPSWWLAIQNALTLH
jgi:hypothetical protein